MLFLTTLVVFFWMAIKTGVENDIPIQTNPNRQTKTSEIDLYAQDIGEWKFMETAQIENVEGLPEKIPVNVAYYAKTISDSRFEESVVNIYRFSSKKSVQSELEKRINFKGCSMVWEKTSGTVIHECLPGGIWWASDNFLINVGDSPRTPGIYIDAYDLVVCPIEGDCEENKQTVYASKEIFDVYAEKYRPDKPRGENLEFPKPKQQPRNFSYDIEAGTYHGNIVIKGYATVSQREKISCKKKCEVYDYVNFNILETDNKNIYYYLKGESGNYFLGQNDIGLGCVSEDGLIWGWNDSSALGMQKFTNSIQTSKAILNSSEKKPITIKIQRSKQSSDGKATDCYSHFDKVQLMK